MITQSDLIQHMFYDPLTGVLSRTSGRYKGSKGCVNSDGAISISFNGLKHKAHRLIWLYVYGVWPDVIDHVNGNPSDNRLSNLRNVTQETNLRNMKLSVRNKSGCTGVCYSTNHNKWMVQVGLGNGKKYSGLFDTYEAAVTNVLEVRNANNYTTHHGAKQSVRHAV